jgi:hypothetical protein
MHANLTSPATKWFGLRFRDDDLNEDQEAKEYLEECEKRVYLSLMDSDFNTEASEVYLDLVSYGTSVIMEEPADDLVWKGIDFTALPMMDTYFEMGPDQLPYRTYRRIRYTQLELETRFPNLPPEYTKMDAEDADVDRKHEVIFCVYYRDNDDIGEIPPSGPTPPDKRPVGYKYVLKRSKFELEEGGYYEYPAFVVRWQKVAGSRWGYSPAHMCLSDIKMLNETVAQTSEARAKVIDPAYMTTERGVIGDLDLEPGGLTLVTDMNQLAPLQNASRFDQADAEIHRLQTYIRSSFFIDRLEMKESPAMTATEVNVRYERMLRLMAPILGRLQNDFLDPLIVRTFKILARMGQLPEQPESVIGQEMDIEYTGPLPRAQHAEVALGIETTMAAMLGGAEVWPEGLDLLDVDQAYRTIAETRGVPAKVLKSADEVEAKRRARADEEEQMKQMAMMQAGGEAAQSAGAGIESLRNVGAPQ